MPFPTFDECLAWRGQVLCGIKVVSALTESSDRWHIDGDVAWELTSPVVCGRGVYARGNLGAWPVSDDLHHRYLDGVRALQGAQKVRV